jgi:copper oxidase (laccase) domain-containing protein
MRAEFGSEPGDLIAAIGPGIGQCCYTVGAEVRERFEEKFSYASELFSLEASQTANGDGNPALSPDLLRLDLIEANRRQLLAAGLQEDSIAVAGSCTSCHPELFYSHRASGGNAGRMMAVIGVR